MIKQKHIYLELNSWKMESSLRIHMSIEIGPYRFWIAPELTLNI